MSILFYSFLSIFMNSIDNCGVPLGFGVLIRLKNCVLMGRYRIEIIKREDNTRRTAAAAAGPLFFFLS